MVTLEIDGKKVEAESGAMVIEAADQAGIYIPRFCYHKKLSIAANCRMCLIEVDKVKKPLPACATPVTEGMKVLTQSAMAREAQKAVMEFLLINHPLDCPVCDQGGQCELQDLSLEFGSSQTQYEEEKRSFDNEDLGSLIATEMTRCIHCTRCVRFGEEIAGVRQMGAMGRGERTQIGTYLQTSLSSEVSGNIIDLCPVGALTSKPFRFKARAWELRAQASIAAHDCLGSHIEGHVSRGQVMRVVPKEYEPINQMWLSDRDRFSYVGLNHPERVRQPLIKHQGVWREVDWQTALNVAVSRLGEVLSRYGADQLGAIASPQLTLEEFYLAQKWLRSLGVIHLDHRLRMTNTRDQDQQPLYPSLGVSLASLESMKSILLVGANVHREAPILGLRVRQAMREGARVWSLGVKAVELHCDGAQHLTAAPQHWIRQCARWLWAVLQHQKKSLPQDEQYVLDWAQLDKAPLTADEQQCAQALCAGQATVMVGALTHIHPQAALLRTLLRYLTQASGASLITLSDGPNSAGAHYAGFVPHRGLGGTPLSQTGYSLAQMFAQPLHAYVLMNVEPELDCVGAAQAWHALKHADINVCLTAYVTPAMREYAHVILPIAPFSETSGTYVNGWGEFQSFRALLMPEGDVRPGWKVISALAQLMMLPDFQYQDIEQVQQEARSRIQSAAASFKTPEPSLSSLAASVSSSDSARVTCVTEWSMYAVDPVVRRSAPLAASASADALHVVLSPALAERYRVDSGDLIRVSQGERVVQLPVRVDPTMAEQCLWVPAGFSETASLNFSDEPIDLERVR